MNTFVRLLGDPAIEADGQVRPVRGHQTWALLTRILLTPRPIDRQTLAAELFPETADPLGSLRWCLASLRKAVDCSTCLVNDPIEINFPPNLRVDVWDLENGSVSEATRGSLLKGIEPRCGPEFATWLLVERERIAAIAESRIRQATVQALSARNFGEAIRLAELGARLNPLDESGHVLLVKSLAAAGRHEASLAHVEATEAVFLTELGEKPSPALRSAARRTVSSPPAGISPDAYIGSLLDAGIDCLRRAVNEAERAADSALLARAALELGTALVHAVRGYDDEGSILLRRATELASEIGDERIAARAYRELGYVEALAGRRPTAASYLASALAVAKGRDELAGVHSVLAFNLVDWGRAVEGLEHYAIALEDARSSGNRRREIWALGMGAWGLLGQDRLSDAGSWLAQCVKLVDDQRWVAFRPWPVALLAECQIRQRATAEGSAAELEQAFALSCQLADPCWEGAVARSIGLRQSELGDHVLALQWFGEGYRRSTRETDGYAALQVKLLGDQAWASRRLGRAHAADALARQWVALAARRHMDAEVSSAANFIATL